LAVFYSSSFRLVIAHIFIFGKWSQVFLIIPILISTLTTVFLAKFIEARANNKVKE
jgi:hypothetical protein